MENKLTKKNKITLIVGIVLFLILVLSASYAYFQITSVNNATTTTIRGTGETLGTPTLSSNTTSLSLNLTAELMTTKNSSKRIYATTAGEPLIIDAFDPDGDRDLISLNNGRYKLATTSVSTSDLSYNCTYNFDVSATVNKTITDGSDQDIHVIVTSPIGEVFRYSLKELLAGTKTINGIITNLTKGDNQEFTIESYVYNIRNYQNDLTGNAYTIKVTPKSGTNGFKCDVATSPKVEGFAKNLIDSNKMIQTGFEADGYRFVGTGKGEFCSYDNGKYYQEKPSNGSCQTLYRIIRTDSSGKASDAGYRNSCPNNTSLYTYSCTTKTGTIVNNATPSNYVCFGTTNKTECTSNPDKYMYRVLGVFSDEYGNQHVKLVKKTSIGQYKWHNDASKKILWQESDLYKGLNGNYFYSNTNYDYIQNSTWRGKIADWRWIASISGNWSHGTFNDHASEFPVDYYAFTAKDVYLHENNLRANKYTTGFWSYTTAKIGLVNVSDSYLSLPYDEYLSSDNKNDYYYLNWLVWPDDGVSFKNYWSTSTYIYFINGKLQAYEITTRLNNDATNNYDVLPAFYLNSDVELSSGTGIENDPYILK